ncbi:hypothetical protein Fmac_003008 [Flemingia macrophylla]|uniref:Uncharacterized protein n=1 Tax=Flemingia macrophylla TaxID=520843 RepID=A0ABD1NNB2_9FABA
MAPELSSVVTPEPSSGGEVSSLPPFAWLFHPRQGASSPDPASQAQAKTADETEGSSARSQLFFSVLNRKSTILVASSIQEAKDRISQIEYVFCSQLYPDFLSK